MKPVYERFIENPDFAKSEFVELIKCAEDPEAVRRLLSAPFLYIGMMTG